MIDLTLDDEQRSLIAAVSAFLGKERPAEGVTDDFWRRNAELGWLGIGVPETGGGVGGGAVEQILVFREIGRSLAPGPFLGTALAAAVARTVSGDVPGAVSGVVAGDQEVTGRLAGGQVRAVLGHSDPLGTAVVFDDGAGDLVVLFDEVTGRALLGDRASLPTAPARPTIDSGFRVETVLESDRDSWAAHEAPLGPVLALGRVLVAAMLSGIAEQTRDMSVEYAGARVQYGKPIGSFQAVKHRCADMAIRAQGAWDLTAVAALRLDAGDRHAQQTAAAAKSVASAAATANAADNIQNHGAIGFTAEHDAHRYLKRSRVLESLCGAPRTLVAELTGPESMW